MYFLLIILGILWKWTYSFHILFYTYYIVKKYVYLDMGNDLNTLFYDEDKYVLYFRNLIHFNFKLLDEQYICNTVYH